MERFPSPRRMRIAVATLTGALVCVGAASGQPFEDARGDFSIALTGDAIITRALSPYREPGFLVLREIIQGATAAFTNLEVLFHDYEPDVIPAAASGGTYMRAEPRLARELTWMGFDLVSRANNHAMDFGVGGARATARAVEAAGLIHAGVGENLAEARAPAYLETPGGRVALISIASTFADPMRAGHQRPDMRGRPGLSPIRYQARYVLPPGEMATLRGVVARVRPFAARADSIRFGGVTFVPGEEGTEASVETRPHPGDLEEILAAVRDARRQADWVVVTSHTHEGAGRRDVAADFIVQVARATIEAGADLFVGHGPHVLRGIEIYEGKPIFYSLGNFIFQNETVELQPYDNYEAYRLGHDALPGEFQDTRIRESRGGFPADPAYWESVLAVARFAGGELAEVRLYPVTLGHGLDRPVRGRPLLAGPEQGERIISGLRELSDPYGARIVWEDGVGVIRP